MGPFRQFIFRYKNNTTHRISIPKRTGLCYSENRIADVTKTNAMRLRKSGYAIFLLKDRRKLPKEHNYRLFCLFPTLPHSVYLVNSVIGSRIDGILFRSFRNQNSSQKNIITTNSVCSHSRKNAPSVFRLNVARILTC